MFFVRRLGKRLERQMYEQAERAMSQKDVPYSSQTFSDQQGNNITVTYPRNAKQKTRKEFTGGKYIDYEDIQ